MNRYAFEEGRTPLIEFRRDTERGLLLGVCAGYFAAVVLAHGA